MPADEATVDRVRVHLHGELAVTERRMFGGVAFMYNGNMAVGVVGDRLMVRVGPDAWRSSLSEPGVSEMDFTGRSMRGFVFVDADALVGDGLAHWVNRGVAFADSLPPK
ncbi:MAG: TfoX/Sxy family protein [Actinomycetota bacterium]|nr:TfoX/Sxy family protein [Actinomycetota bacterium]